MFIRYFIGIVFIVTILTPREAVARDRIDYEQIVWFDIARDDAGDIVWFEPENEYNFKGYIKGIIFASPYRVDTATARMICTGEEFADSIYYKAFFFRLNLPSRYSEKLKYLYVLKRKDFLIYKNGKREFSYKVREYELGDGVFRLRIYKYQDENSFTSN